MHRMSSCSAAVTFGRPALMCLEAVKPESIEQKSKYHDIIISLMNINDINDINDTNHDEIVNIYKARKQK